LGASSSHCSKDKDLAMNPKEGKNSIHRSWTSA
jgi:hypothetical protein